MCILFSPRHPAKPTTYDLVYTCKIYIFCKTCVHKDEAKMTTEHLKLKAGQKKKRDEVT